MITKPGLRCTNPLTGRVHLVTFETLFDRALEVIALKDSPLILELVDVAA